MKFDKRLLVILLTTIPILLVASALYPQDKLETATIRVGTKDVVVEIAIDPKSREKGLMHREELAEDSGMLFVYPTKRKARLWMKNTLIPLSAAFIEEDGTIAQIVKMEKVDSAKVYRSKTKIKYALEMALGWFEKNGVTVGDKCEIEIESEN